MKRLPYQILLLAAAAFLAWQISRDDARPPESAPAGLEVYLGEGCIHCHSQYRRPDAADQALWGPPTDAAAAMRSAAPVLFGNRRQGPDLSNVGLRRSRDWNRLHLADPRAVRPGSRMPSYAHLFAGDGARGEALLDYLASLGTDAPEAWRAHVDAWQPQGALDGGDAAAGARLYAGLCAACHGPAGAGDGPLAASLKPAPRDLRAPAGWLWVTPALQPEQRRAGLARLIKHGRAGTSMAGTEWLTEDELANLVRHLETLAYPDPR